MNDKMTTGNGPNRKRRKYQEDYRLGNVKMMIQQEEWLKAHPDYHKKWRKRNPRYYNKWRAKNPEYFKQWLEGNADHRRSYMTQYMRKYRGRRGTSDEGRGTQMLDKTTTSESPDVRNTEEQKESP